MSQEIPSKILSDWSANSIGTIPLAIDQLIKGEVSFGVVEDIRRLRNIFNKIPSSLTPDQLAYFQQRAKVAILAELYRFLGYELPNVPTTRDLVTELSAYYDGLLDAQRSASVDGLAVDFYFAVNRTISSNELDFMRLTIQNPQEWQRQKELILSKHFLVIGFLSRGTSAGAHYLLNRIAKLVEEGSLKAEELGDYVDDLLFFGATGISDTDDTQFVSGTSAIVYDQVWQWLKSEEDFAFAITLGDDVVSRGNTFEAFLIDLFARMQAQGATTAMLDRLATSITMYVPGTNTEFLQTEKYYSWSIYENKIRLVFITIDRKTTT